MIGQYVKSSEIWCIISFYVTFCTTFFKHIFEDETFPYLTCINLNPWINQQHISNRDGIAYIIFQNILYIVEPSDQTNDPHIHLPVDQDDQVIGIINLGYTATSICTPPNSDRIFIVNNYSSICIYNSLGVYESTFIPGGIINFLFYDEYSKTVNCAPYYCNGNCYIINPTTLSYTTITFSGIQQYVCTGMDVDPDTGYIYMCAYGTPYGLWKCSRNGSLLCQGSIPYIYSHSYSAGSLIVHNHIVYVGMETYCGFYRASDLALLANPTVYSGYSLCNNIDILIEEDNYYVFFRNINNGTVFRFPTGGDGVTPTWSEANYNFRRLSTQRSKGDVYYNNS